MDLRYITDWTILPGASIEIRQQNSPVCSGYVDTVTDDGNILWLQIPAQSRRLFEKAELYEAWAVEDSTKVTNGIRTPAEDSPVRPSRT